MQAAIRMFVKRQRYKRLLRERRELFAACKVKCTFKGKQPYPSTQRSVFVS